MVERCLIAASEISKAEVLNNTTVTDALSQLGSLKTTRLIVTDQAGMAIYDSYEQNSVLGKYALLPEIVLALKCNDTFTSRYHDGAIQSQAATPILSYGTIAGCVYMMEYDTEQGALIQSLQRNILSVTIILVCIVIIFSIFFANIFSGRIRRIQTPCASFETEIIRIKSIWADMMSLPCSAMNLMT